MSKTLSLKTYAKINLTLDVTGKREDGYHNIDSVFEEISIYDTVSVATNDSGRITVSCSVPGIPCDEHNIVYKAASIFFEETGIKNPGVHIHIEKNIPSQAGMGGGSTNAAGVFRILDKLFETNLSDEKLCEIAVRSGADTPFFIRGGLAHLSGIGDIIKPLSSLSEHYIVVAKGTEGVSTPAAYLEIDSLENVPHQNTEAILKACRDDDINTLMANALNTFELTKLPDDIAKIRDIMKKHNTTGTLMTGSGAAVFGIFTDKAKAEAAEKELDSLYPFAMLCSNICPERNNFS